MAEHIAPRQRLGHVAGRLRCVVGDEDFCLAAQQQGQAVGTVFRTQPEVLIRVQLPQPLQESRHIRRGQRVLRRDGDAR